MRNTFDTIYQIHDHSSSWSSFSNFFTFILIFLLSFLVVIVSTLFSFELIFSVETIPFGLVLWGSWYHHHLHLASLRFLLMCPLPRPPSCLESVTSVISSTLTSRMILYQKKKKLVGWFHLRNIHATVLS